MRDVHPVHRPAFVCYSVALLLCCSTCLYDLRLVCVAAGQDLTNQTDTTDNGVPVTTSSDAGNASAAPVSSLSEDVAAAIVNVTTLRNRLKRSQLVLKNITEALRLNQDGDSKKCTPAPPLNISYAVYRYQKQAGKQAVANSIFLSNLWARQANPAGACSKVEPGTCGRTTVGGSSDPSVYADQLVVFERLRTSTLSDTNIFATGGCFGAPIMSLSCNLTCVYASRNVTYAQVKKNSSLADKYGKSSLDEFSQVIIDEYIGNEPEWFYGPRNRFNKAIADNRSEEFRYRRLPASLGWSPAVGEDSVWDTRVTYEHGYWTRPYFDCKISFVWMISFMMPIVIPTTPSSHSTAVVSQGTGSELNSTATTSDVQFMGVTGVDIELGKVDINQCLEKNTHGQVFSDDLTNTHLCPSSTDCVFVSGGGFTSGSYRCRCKDNYYYDASGSAQPYVNGYSGSDIDAFVLSLAEGRCNETGIDALDCLAATITRAFSCKQCHQSCQTCNDSSRCLYENNQAMVISMSVLNLAGVVMAIVFAVVIIVCRKRKVIKAASWPFLVTALVGAMLMFGPGIKRPYVSVSIQKLRCKLDVVLETAGFSLLYGSIFIKIWRIQQLISPKFLKKTLVRGQNLDGRAIARRLLLLLVLTVLFLVLWMLAMPPELSFKEVPGDLNYYQCNKGPFGYASFGVQLGLMLWGAYLCQRTRNVAAKFTDSRELTISIYMFIAVVSLAKTLEYALLTGHADEEQLLYTLRVQITVTVTALIIFVPKAREIYHSSLFYKRRVFRRDSSRNRRTGRMSQVSIGSVDRGRSLHRASILSRTRSDVLSAPLEKRVSKTTVNVPDSLPVSNGTHRFIQRTSSIASPNSLFASQVVEADEANL
ncbi:uncharacterized protein LOC135815507 [Sycon ciliatum]|uniref:uncharacterized protein LOC135815507 n=1 Tax=Sycon ciliatum TaxID=27933 RepID=UPI0031F6106A